MVRARPRRTTRHVGVVVDPADYDALLDELRANGALSAATRRRLAAAAFAHTAAYDAAIVTWLDDGGRRVGDDPLPPTMHLALDRRSRCATARTRIRSAPATASAAVSWWDTAIQHGGKELSYLNLYDTEAAWRLVHTLGDRPACAVIKHANPCGVAVADDITHCVPAAPTSAIRCRRSAASSRSTGRSLSRWPRSWRRCSPKLWSPRLRARRARGAGGQEEPAGARSARAGVEPLATSAPSTAGCSCRQPTSSRSIVSAWTGRDRGRARPTRNGSTSSWRGESRRGDVQLHRAGRQTARRSVSVPASRTASMPARIAAEKAAGRASGRRGGQRRVLPVPRRSRRRAPTRASPR